MDEKQHTDITTFLDKNPLHGFGRGALDLCQEEAYKEGKGIGTAALPMELKSEIKMKITLKSQVTHSSRIEITETCTLALLASSLALEGESSPYIKPPPLHV